MSGLDEKAVLAACEAYHADLPTHDPPSQWAMEQAISAYLAATTPADVGKLVERLRERARTMNGAEPVGAGDGHTYTLCYYSAGDRGLDREAATALERVTRELDAIRTKLATVEAETRERAAMLGYAICAETRHVTLGDKVAEAIRNLEPRS